MSRLIAENGNIFRRRRFAKFLSLVDEASTPGDAVRILDLGGSVSYWEALRPMWNSRNFVITMINIDREDADMPPHYRVRTGNACDLREYEDNSFDIVHSNSVIEHVGDWGRMKAMAAEVRRLAPHHFIQTPNFWFPLEPHAQFPLWQFLPEGTRARLLLKKKRGFLERCSSFDEAMGVVQGSQLLSSSQMQALFPDSLLFRERVLGLCKSITAVL